MRIAVGVVTEVSLLDERAHTSFERGIVIVGLSCSGSIGGNSKVQNLTERVPLKFLCVFEERLRVIKIDRHILELVRCRIDVQRPLHDAPLILTSLAWL